MSGTLGSPMTEGIASRRPALEVLSSRDQRTNLEEVEVRVAKYLRGLRDHLLAAGRVLRVLIGEDFLGKDQLYLLHQM